MRRTMPGGADAIVPDAMDTALQVDRRRSTVVKRPSNKASTWMLAAILSGLAAFPLQESLTRFPRGLLADDAYFYVKVAWNLGTRGASTFDGIHVTDGYHLAWQSVLAAVSFLAGRFSANPSVHLGAMLWLYLMMCWAIGIVFGRSGVDALLLLGVGLIFKVLMETTLLSLVLVALYANVYLSPPGESSDTRTHAWRPWLLVLIPLVRIDATLIAVLMVLSRLFEAAEPGHGSSHRLKVKAVVADLAWVGAGVVLQLAWRWWYFGEFTSVSMQIKSAPGSMAQRFQNNLIGLYGSNLASTAIFVFLFALSIWAAIRRDPCNRRRDLVALSAPAAFVILHLAANNQIAYWYFLPAA